ncbi:MAG: neurogenic locus notch [Legionella sp.]|nr:neurogenic locus notch [Legionella sp.]
MTLLRQALLTSLFFLKSTTSFCNDCSMIYVPPCDQMMCCGDMGGISYCDSSAGRYVCNNGYYSACYCTRHAVMDLQKLQGCCLWQGGVLTIDEAGGTVLCNNGTFSEICSIQSPHEKIAAW